MFYLIGYYQKALKYYKNAVSLRSECALVNRSSFMILAQGNYEEFKHFLDSICIITPCQQICDMLRFYSCAIQKKYADAEKYYNKAVDAGYQPTFFDDVYIAFLYQETGKKEEALSLLNTLVRREEEYILHANGRILINKARKLQLAAYYALLDENKKAIGCLSELEKEGIFEYPITLNAFPGFDNLRNDPEFKAIMKRIRDNQASLRAQVREMELRGEIDL